MMKKVDDLSRHDLVWLDPQCWQAGLRSELREEAFPPIAEWIGRGLPAVVRMQRQDSPSSVLSLGIPLSSDKGRMRIALDVSREAVIRVEAPLLLTRVIPSAPVHWQKHLYQLAHRFYAIRIAPRVYGSLAWQHLAGRPYLTERSDVDLLFHVRDPRQIEGAVDMLSEWETTSGVRADGEMVLGNGDAIAWRELLQTSRKILVKSISSVSLLSFGEILKSFEGKETTDAANAVCPLRA